MFNYLLTNNSFFKESVSQNLYLICGVILFYLVLFPAHAATKDYSDRHQIVLKPDKFYCLTHFVEIDDLFFVVDCYNNRVLYSDSLEKPPGQWHVLDSTLSWPHSIAGDGEFFIVDDSYADKISIYQRTESGFKKLTKFFEVGKRPHRVIYDSVTQAFYALSSLSQTMTKIKNKDGKLEIIHTRKLPYLGGHYTRSFSISGQYMYFVSGPGKISKAAYIDGNYSLVRAYSVPATYRDMIDIIYFGGKYYITAIRNIILECEELEDIETSACKNIYKENKFQGVPYYFTQIGQDLYVTSLGSDNVLKFVTDMEKHKARTVTNN
ncbi:MAG: hypothetical protein D6B25_19740 [Desulfobulbaceae bacterium]|nr:MAG: hypothetical protein D6B25_19740 [Desulfobulbaceae bacterium]